MAKKKAVMKERSGNWLKKNYSLSWKYIKESSAFIWTAAIIFLIAIIFGFVNHSFFSEYIRTLLDELLKQTEGLGALQMIYFILENNAKNAFFGMIAGIAVGLFSIFSLLLNGYVLGYVSYFASQKSGYLVLLDLLPHGIFEIPALLISLGLGIKMGAWIFTGKGMKKIFIYRIKESLRVFIFVILPLLIIAAVIEGLLISFL